MAVYDLIFFCHADTFCSIEGDEARRDSRGYQLLFSDVLAGLLSDTYSGVCPLEMSDLGKRKELVRAEILEYLEIEPPSTSA